MPDEVVTVEKIPLGATGKINKLALREMFQGLQAAIDAGGGMKKAVEE
jgi:non-ribosomal peptide synthetase component E (peptide arylation enzyme)